MDKGYDLPILDISYLDVVMCQATKRKVRARITGDTHFSDQIPVNKEEFIAKRHKRKQKKRDASRSFDRRWNTQRPIRRNKYNEEPEVSNCEAQKFRRVAIIESHPTNASGCEVDKFYVGSKIKLIEVAGGGKHTESTTAS